MTETRTLITTILIASLSGFAGAAIWQFSGMGDAHTRQYLLDHPEILPEMASAYEAQQGKERLGTIRESVAAPFPGAVLGNPEGAITLVEFSDYACVYCKVSREHVDALIAANPDLKVVIREWPIFEGSDQAASMALAAAKQGKFAEFHRAMFATGRPSTATIAQAANKAGLDLEAAEDFAASETAQFELSKNAGFARTLAFTGTPAWVVGDQVIEGAVGPEELQQAIDAARGS